mmetsp:Transcript_25719/g.44287  ORF Transcript_25719/g.44287 Transcript_25719/m.44287 type:complete len:194 (+) Transcript_25719:71-652(+)|eukprot:CAMPEP_0196661636 /NCGR_PEP_ID=MMETSP1086-20130531/45300_1 /TAXON_ID=77921 /ORGANISM="Cyanoptyche  gloeocystis , Strain SAG4.97" /LENGTH=193 /DNA_ID=CAMNT_0041996633 /DNA_START=71 /DNA_END=652 /DNA_ORIENTATION=+
MESMKRLSSLDTRIADVIFKANASPGRRFLWESYSWSGDGFFWLLISPALTAFYWRKDENVAADVLANAVIAFLFDILVVVLLKALVKRPRPSHNMPDYKFIGPDKHSFPSGHSTRAFLLAFWALNAGDLSWISLLVFLWAMVLAASRLALGRHYPSDVASGIIIGYLEYVVFDMYVLRSGFSFVQFVKKLSE